jgi:hypothetical protein
LSSCSTIREVLTGEPTGSRTEDGYGARSEMPEFEAPPAPEAPAEEVAAEEPDWDELLGPTAGEEAQGK